MYANSYPPRVKIYWFCCAIGNLKTQKEIFVNEVK